MRVRIGLIPKLVLSAILVLSVMVVGLVMAMRTTFETDISAYIHRVEVDQISSLADLLGQEYERTGGWEYLTETQDTWPMLIAEVLDGVVPESRSLNDVSMDVIGVFPRLTIRDRQGRLVVRSPLPPRPESISKQAVIPVIANGETVGTLRMVPTPIPVKGLDRQFRDDQLYTFYLAAIPALIITLLMAIPLGYHFARPLQRLARGIHQLASNNYAVRLEEERNDELGELARDFNHLAIKLENTERQRREGMASVSHELRTPLATMIGSVEAMQDGIRPLDTEQLKRLSGTMEHLNTLVDDLYQLALADVGKLVCNREVIDWTGVIDNALEAIRGKIMMRGLTLQCELEPGLGIKGDPQRLRQVVTNLLENCYRYTEENGKVVVRLEREGDHAMLTVSDSGPGVSDDKLDILFERFSRIDVSRSRDYGGAGLGLALVMAIAKAHDGAASAFRAAEGGLSIRISLPLTG